jgi:hypothetical protein
MSDLRVSDRICEGNVPSLERTRFFPRQLVTPDDLTQDQIYFRDKHRRHNRMLHGWGVVCGARVKGGKEKCQVVVEHGYILGPYGDEIVIPEDITFDVCKEDPDGNVFSACGEPSDPWCRDVRAERRPNQVYYLAVRYDECRTRPVTAHAAECGCSEPGCEYSRIRDSFSLKVLSELPESYRDMQPPSLARAFRCTEGSSCPPCPDDPWVILADLTLAADGSIEKIDCYAHRRYVISFAGFYYMCSQDYGRLPKDVLVGAYRPMLYDVRAQAEKLVATRAVSVRLASGEWASLPAHFAVQPGETVRSFLAREGERTYYDTSADATYTLNELYSLAGARPDAVLHSEQDALAPLEGLKLRVADLRVVSDGLTGLLDEAGLSSLQKNFLGAPEATAELPAANLRGLSPASRLGKKLAQTSIAEVAAQPVEDFVKSALAGAPAREKTALESQARELWNSANRVVRLGNTWKAG